MTEAFANLKEFHTMPNDPTNPKDASIDGVDADPQGSNFSVKIEDTRNRKVQADAHASITNAAGPIMRSAVASHGGRLSTPPTEDSIVEVRGQTMKVSTAVRMGFVVKTADGFADATADNTPTMQDGGPEGQQDGESGPKANEPDETNSLQVEPEMQDAIIDLSAGLESIGANPVSVLGEIMSDPQGEKGLPASVLNLARERGFDEGAVAEHLQDIKVAVAESVEDFIMTNTELPEEDLRPFIESAMSPQSAAEFQQAVRNMVFLTEPAGLLEMVSAFQRRKR